jgi:hypothetical protein
MEVSGQLHALVALLPRKSSLIPTVWEAGWTKSQLIIIRLKLLPRILALERGGCFYLAQTLTDQQQ